MLLIFHTWISIYARLKVKDEGVIILFIFFKLVDHLRLKNMVTHIFKCRHHFQAKILLGS